jgi:hypothetical protein
VPGATHGVISWGILSGGGAPSAVRASSRPEPHQPGGQGYLGGSRDQERPRVEPGFWDLA